MATASVIYDDETKAILKRCKSISLDWSAYLKSQIGYMKWLRDVEKEEKIWRPGQPNEAIDLMGANLVLVEHFTHTRLPALTKRIKGDFDRRDMKDAIRGQIKFTGERVGLELLGIKPVGLGMAVIGPRRWKANFIDNASALRREIPNSKFKKVQAVSNSLSNVFNEALSRLDGRLVER